MSETAFNDLLKNLAEQLKHKQVGDQIRYPIEVSNLVLRQFIEKHTERTGKWVSIRPVDDAKTYLGVYLGDLGRGIMHSYDTQSKELQVFMYRNPAIFVPDLKRIVWGDSSWWKTIETQEDLQTITDADIQDTWYVKALNDFAGSVPAADEE